MQARMWSVTRKYYRQRHFITKIVRSRLAHLMGSADHVNPTNLQGWAPFVLRKDYVVWVDMKDQRLKSGFAERDFLRAARKPHAVRTTGIGALEQAVDSGAQPTGFVFHIARCGSTLLRNMLAATPGSLALGEPMIVNDIVNGNAPDETKAARAAGAIRSLCHPYVGDETRFFIKFTSSCAIHLEMFRRCFPATPMVYLYRDPVEVIVACLRDGDSHWLRARGNPAFAERLTGLDRSFVSHATPEEYAARTIGNYLQLACEHQGALLPINYSRLLEPETLKAVCRFFGIADTDDTLAQMRGASEKDAKRQGTFVPDSDRRRQAASPDVRAAVDRWCLDAYQRLDALSTSRVQALLEAGAVTGAASTTSAMAVRDVIQ